MTGKGWITGEDIRSRPMTHIDQDYWDSIFKKGKYKRHNYQQGEDLCSVCGKEIDDPIHIPLI